MFNAVRGTLCHKGADTIRIDNNGVEWEFAVPARSVDSFGRLGDETRALCWLLHRDDQMRLFGFVSEAERSVFIELMTVDGIGPKQALKILAGIGADDLERALDAEDLARLEAIPGLGKKTAQKLVFSLKGKLPSHFATQASTARPKGYWSAWVYYPVATAHGDGNNAAYFDGHVKWANEGWINSNYWSVFVDWRN